MGLFDNIKEKAVGAAGEYKTAYEWAQGQSAEAIAEAMKDAKGMTLNGYRAVFRDKCDDMDLKALRALYDEVTGRNKPGIRINLSLKTNHAEEILKEIFDHRGFTP